MRTAGGISRALDSSSKGCVCSRPSDGRSCRDEALPSSPPPSQARYVLEHQLRGCLTALNAGRYLCRPSTLLVSGCLPLRLPRLRALGGVPLPALLRHHGASVSSVECAS